MDDVYAAVAQGRTDDAIDALFELADDIACDGDCAEMARLMADVDLERLDLDLVVAALCCSLWFAVPERVAFAARCRARIAELAPERVDRLTVGLM